jgi:uncharacterized protein YceK
MALAVAALAGCGTCINLGGEPLTGGGTREVYGGVAWDASVVSNTLQDGGLPYILVGAYLLAVDLPLSAVADTLTLPLTIPALKTHFPEHPTDPASVLR